MIMPYNKDHPEAPLLQVVVADDEHLGRKRVLDLLAGIEDVHVAGVAKTGQEVIQQVSQKNPNLVFLDIHMPDCSGIDVVRQIGPDEMPATIFVTAYDQYAIDAFKLAPLDYLLKPFEDARFYEALARAREFATLRHAATLSNRYRALLEHPHSTSQLLHAIPVQSKGQRIFVDVGQICYLSADGVYVEIHTKDRVFLKRETLRALESQLDPTLFFRIHRSLIVRLSCITTLKIGEAGNHAVVLNTGIQLPVARSRKDELERRLQYRR